MATTRAFKSGDSQAVRIPAEMAYEDMSKELTITRSGDVITMYPAKAVGLASPTMAETVAKLRAMPRPSGIAAYEPTEFPHRERE